MCVRHHVGPVKELKLQLVSLQFLQYLDQYLHWCSDLQDSDLQNSGFTALTQAVGQNAGSCGLFSLEGKINCGVNNNIRGCIDELLLSTQENSNCKNEVTCLQF